MDRTSEDAILDVSAPRVPCVAVLAEERGAPSRGYAGRWTR
jgi:hypothetical protein